MTQAPAPAPVPSTGRRERNRDRTRRALEDAALGLFAEHGYDNVTVEDIAALADVSPRTFFRYFASKDDVIRLEPPRLRLVLDHLAERPVSEGPLQAVRGAFAALGPAFEQDRDRILLRNRAIATTPSLLGRALEMERAWEEAIALGLARREGRRSADSRLRAIAAASMAMVRSALNRWLDANGKTNLPKVIAEQFDLLIGALKGPKPSARSR